MSSANFFAISDYETCQSITIYWVKNNGPSQPILWSATCRQGREGNPSAQNAHFSFRAWEVNSKLSPDPESIFCHFRMDACNIHQEITPKKYWRATPVGIATLNSGPGLTGSRPRGPDLGICWAWLRQQFGCGTLRLDVSLVPGGGGHSERQVPGLLHSLSLGHRLLARDVRHVMWCIFGWFLLVQVNQMEHKEVSRFFGWKNWENIFRMQRKYDEKKGWKLKRRNSSLPAWTSHSICSSDDMFAVWRSADLMPQWSWIEEKLSQAWYVLGLIG